MAILDLYYDPLPRLEDLGERWMVFFFFLIIGELHEKITMILLSLLVSAILFFFFFYSILPVTCRALIDLVQK